MKRRPFLAATGVTLAAPTAGCLAARASAPPDSDGPTDTWSDDVPESSGPVRGESTADLDVRDVEDDEVEYLSEDDAVRYVAARRRANQDAVENGSEPPTREPVYETTPFEEWAEIRCHSAAAQAAAEHANDELDTDEVGGGISSAVEGHDLVAAVAVRTVLDRDGEVVHGTDVEFQALVAATPATVTATYVLEGRERELSVPVYARHSVLQQQ